MVDALKQQYPDRIGIVTGSPPATFIIPIIGLTPTEKTAIEASSPAGGTFKATNAIVSEATLKALEKRLGSELSGVTMGLASKGVEVITAKPDDALRQKVQQITIDFLKATPLPAGASTNPDDYVTVIQGTVSNVSNDDPVP